LSQKISELGANLLTTEFSLVREKISAKLSSTIVSTLAFNLSDELDKPEGVRARTERPWDGHLSYIQKTVEGLPERDRPLGRTIVANFIRQCDRFSKIVIQIPALKIPKDEDYSRYNYNRSDHPLALRLDAIVRKADTKNPKRHRGLLQDSDAIVIVTVWSRADPSLC
jgi:hypothetical protein